MGTTANALLGAVRQFGPRPAYAALAASRCLYGSFAAAARACDDLVGSAAVATPLVRPVFVVGLLRSGTTFLHRFLLEHCPELRGACLWEMLFPSHCARRLLRPFRGVMGRLSLDRVYSPELHRTGMLAAEADDIAIMARFFDGMLHWVYFEAWQSFPTESAVDQAFLARCRQPRFVDLIKALHRENVRGTAGYRMLSKSFFGALCLDELEMAFPEASFIVLLRDPAETIPSLLSFETRVQAGLHGRYGVDQDGELVRRYAQNMYRAALAYYRELDAAIQPRRERPNVLVVTHRQLRTAFADTLSRIVAACGLQRGPHWEAALSQQSAIQEGYVSAHRYCLTDYGLHPEQLEADFGFAYRDYDLRQSHPAGPVRTG